MDPDEMPLPTLRNKQEYFGIRREETLTKEKSLCFQNFDPDERKPKNILSVVDSPLNDSLMMLEDLAQDIKNDIVGESVLFPCSVCGRTFSKSSLERHARVCEKVKSTPKRKVFNVEKLGEDLKDELAYISPLVTPVLPRKESVKKERKGCDDLQLCSHCSRKFGPKAFDDHVKWCEEKKRRLQDSPKKDHEALAKLSLRTTYKPKTPVAARKSLPSNGQNQPEIKSDDRKESFESTKSEPTPTLRTKSRGPVRQKQNVYHTQSLNRSDSCRYYGDSRPKYTEAQSSASPLKRVSSLGRHSDISYLNKREHTEETENTKIIRQQTGRGSIRRPAPTRSSLLRRKSSHTGSQPLNEDQQPKYQYKRTSSGGRTIDAIDSYSTSDVVKPRTYYSNISRQGSPTKIPASNANLSYAPNQTPNTIRRIPQYMGENYNAQTSKIAVRCASNGSTSQKQVEKRKVENKAPGMSAHQNYFNQMRQKLTRNFNKTFGRGYDITNKQSSVSHLDAIDKSQVVGNTYKERFVSTTDIATHSYQLQGKLLDGRAVLSKTVQRKSDFDVSYNPYELAAKQMRELMEESLKAKRKDSYPHFTTKEFTDHEWDQYCRDSVTKTSNSSFRNIEQSENQIDYYVESNSLMHGDDENLLNMTQEDSFVKQTLKPKSPMRLMLTDFPDLNSEADESDSFKDFLRLEAELLTPSPKSIRGERKNSVISERSEPESIPSSSPEIRKFSRTTNQQSLARFCYECGCQFPLPSIRFCCECGVQRLRI